MRAITPVLANLSAIGNAPTNQSPRPALFGTARSKEGSPSLSTAKPANRQKHMPLVIQSANLANEGISKMDNTFGSNAGGTTAVSIYRTQTTSPMNKLVPRVNIPLRVDLVDQPFGSSKGVMNAARSIMTPNAELRTLSPDQLRNTNMSNLANKNADRRQRNYSTLIGGTGVSTINKLKTQHEYFQEHIRRASNVPPGNAPPGNLDCLQIKPIRGSGAKTANNPQARSFVQAGRNNDQLGESANLSVTEMIRNGMRTTFNLTNPKYGLKHYTMRTSKFDDGKIPSIAVNKLDKQDHFTDLAANKTIKFPSAKYDIVRDWAKDPIFPNSQNRIRGQFLKARRTTFTDETMGQMTKRHVPGPIYKVPQQLADIKQKATSVNKEVKACVFLEQAEYVGQKYPSTKLNQSYAQIDKSPRSPRMWAESEKDKASHQRNRIKRIEKDKSPSPGSYEDQNAFRNTQGQRIFQFGRDERVTFTDVVKKKKKNLPSPSTYKYDVIASLNKISGSPRSVAVRRH